MSSPIADASPTVDAGPNANPSKNADSTINPSPEAKSEQAHSPIPHRVMAGLVVVAGSLMAAYLLLRPYGDASGGDTSSAMEAYASPMWVVAHLAGAASLVMLAIVWVLAASGAVRWVAVAGAALVLPYYGAETFALHEIGAMALAGDTSVVPLVAAVRDNPVAMPLFGVGLLALAGAGIAAALRVRRTCGDEVGGAAGRALLPLAIVAALFLTQFFLPPAGEPRTGWCSPRQPPLRHSGFAGGQRPDGAGIDRGAALDAHQVASTRSPRKTR